MENEKCCVKETEAADQAEWAWNASIALYSLFYVNYEYNIIILTMLVFISIQLTLL